MRGRDRMGWHALLALLLSLVLAQSLGLIHRFAHDRPLPTQPLAVTAGERCQDSWLASLFGSHDEQSPECRLLDGAGHAAPPTVAALAAPVLPLAQVVAITHAEFIARWVALFDARGPPSSR